ncbi:hypothetical protein HYFRA_00007549 [Hymenoscyphus fraxineus]|uniref:Mitochondrial import inner membrane translocase subunit TIM50 n=1 Tax=Hymenoscyphus fraxineus TaxID=746836 RepID=A0A9N9PMX4_9HELO|nr:hypothetical protein HYFRA_00007549 [Hymenoscyphus fraxineus]
MLSRSVARLQHPGLRITSTQTPRIASSVWTRSMAHNNKPNNQNKPQGSTEKPGNQPRPPPPPAGAFKTPQSSDRGGKVAAGEAPNATSKTGAESAYSEKQKEFETVATPSESQSAIDAAEAEAHNRPLPDLTQGIPSTLEYETIDSTGKKNLPAFDLTEASEDGPGGRGRGELPASAYMTSAEKKRLRMANYMYAAFAAAVVAGTVYLGRNWDTEEEAVKHATEAPSGWSLVLMWARARARLSDQLNYYSEPAFPKLLPDPDPVFERPYTLVLSLEDLLIHSEWTREHGWRMAKRPGVDYFLRYLSQYFEIVVWTSQPMGMAEQVVRKFDPFHIITWPLFREATLYENGEYIKDISYLNRDLSKVIVVDTKAAHVKNQPENAIILKPWQGQVGDKDLVGLIPFLEYIHTMNYQDVRKALKSFEGKHIPTEFARREAIARQKFQLELAEERKKRPKHSGAGFLASALGIKPAGAMMMDPNDITPAEAFAQGKMLQDLARERGQRNYEALEKEIRENGEKWLKEEAAQEEKMREEGMKQMKTGFLGYFGGASPEASK